MSSLDLHKIGSINSQGRMERDLVGGSVATAYTELLLIVDSMKGEVIAFSCNNVTTK